MIIRKLVILFMVFFLAGCSSFYYPSNQQFEYFTKPEIGVPLTASLGEPIVTTENGYYADGLYVNNPKSSSRAIFWTLQINRGFYELVHSDDKYKYYYPENKGMIKHFTNNKDVLDSPDAELRIGDNNSFGVVSKVLGGIYFNSKSLRKKLEIEPAENYFVLTKNSIQHTMIYTGKSEDILKFSYREFSDNIFRPAFATEITYDLTSSKIIGYKSFRAEVIEASNTEIKYKILQGFY